MRNQWAWKGIWLSGKNAASKPDSLITEQFDSWDSHGRRRDNSHMFADLHIFSVPCKSVYLQVCVRICMNACVHTHTHIIDIDR